MVKMDKVFAVTPASSSGITWLWVIGAFVVFILIGVITLLALTGYQFRHASVTLTGQGLRVGPGLYSRTIPKEDISIEGVRVIDLNAEKNYQPKWRTNGASLPGYNAGWFKLQNGEKALLFLTDRSSVVYVPTTDNYSLMVSVQDATEMVEAIRQWEK
jgi:hypothetical protein